MNQLYARYMVDLKPSCIIRLSTYHCSFPNTFTGKFLRNQRRNGILALAYLLSRII